MSYRDLDRKVRTLANVSVSGLRVSSKNAAGDITASCTVHYQDGSSSLEYMVGRNHFLALRGLVSEVAAIDKVNGPRVA